MILSFSQVLVLTLTISLTASVSAGVTVNEDLVSFPSLALPSGSITLYGSVFYASSSSSSSSSSASSSLHSCAVLVGGSGPTDRYSTDSASGYQPLRQLALSLASAGYIVLAYDKRSCLSGAHPTCVNVPCSPTVTNNCVNVVQLRQSDFQADLAAALLFLSSTPTVNKYSIAKSCTLIGHSEGVTTASNALATILSSSSPPYPALSSYFTFSVIGLMGVGASPDAVLYDQSQVQLPVVVSELIALEQLSPVTPTIQAQIAAVNSTIQSFQCTIATVKQQYENLRMNVMPVDTSGVVCFQAVQITASLLPALAPYNITSAGSYCPAQCGTGLCHTGLNSLSCLALCSVGAQLGGCIPSIFANDSLTVQSPANIGATCSTLSQHSIPFLTVNSPSDLLVSPVDYSPLISFASQAYSSVGHSSLYASVLIGNLTHLMNPSPVVTPLSVDPRVLQAVQTFVTQYNPTAAPKSGQAIKRNSASTITIIISAIAFTFTAIRTKA